MKKNIKYETTEIWKSYIIILTLLKLKKCKNKLCWACVEIRKTYRTNNIMEIKYNEIQRSI